MANSGFWTAALEGTADRLNAGFLQYDITASKPAAGQTGRTFWDTTLSQLERDNGATWDIVLGTDPAAATPGLRTLGTGAAQAAAGNHTHTLATAANGEASGSKTNVAVGDTTEYDAASVARTPGAAGRAFVVFATIRQRAGVVDSIIFRLYVDAVEIDTVTVTDGEGYLLHGFSGNPSVASHTIKLTGQRLTDGVEITDYVSSVGYQEVYNS